MFLSLNSEIFFLHPNVPRSVSVPVWCHKMALFLILPAIAENWMNDVFFLCGNFSPQLKAGLYSPHYQTGIIAETSPVWRIQGRLTFQSEHGGIWVTTTMSFLAGCLLATVLCVWRSFEAKLWHHKKMRSVGVPNKVWCPEVIRGRLLVNKLTFSIFYLDCCFF